MSDPDVVRVKSPETGKIYKIPRSQLQQAKEKFGYTEAGSADGAVGSRQKEAQGLLDAQKKGADKGNALLESWGTRLLDDLGFGATQRMSAKLATNPAEMLMAAPIAMMGAFLPDKAKEHMTSWGEINPHADTGIPVTYAKGSAERDMHSVLEGNVDQARAATEFGPAVPEDVPVVGGMSLGGTALDILFGAPAAIATGATSRVANAGALAGGALKAPAKDALHATGRALQRLAKSAVQAGKEALPFGAAMGYDEPTQDPEWEHAERAMNAGGSAAAASLFGSGTVALGRLIGLPATGVVKWLRSSRKSLGGGQTLGGEVRRLELARELAGDSPAATSLAHPLSVRPPSNVKAALDAEMRGESASPGEFIKGQLVAEFPEQMGLVESQRQRVNQGLDIASSAGQSEAQAVHRQARANFEGFVDKAAEKLDTMLTSSKKRMASELDHYFSTSEEAKTAKVSAAPLVQKLRRMWEEGMSEGSPNPFTSAPEFEKQMRKGMSVEVFVDDGGSASEKLYATHGQDMVDMIPYGRAQSRGLLDGLDVDSKIRSGVEKWKKWEAGGKNGSAPSGALDPANVKVAVRPKELGPVELDTIIRSLNDAVNAASNRGNTPTNLAELHAAAMNMRRPFAQLESLKKRHASESEALAEGVRALGVEGFKDMTQLPPRSAIRSRLRAALLEPVETAERQGAMSALRQAGLGGDIAKMEAEARAQADLASLIKDAEAIGDVNEARSKLRGQLEVGDPAARDLASILSRAPAAGSGVEVLYTRPSDMGPPRANRGVGGVMQDAMKEASELRSLASELGMDPGGVLDAPEEKIANDMMDAVWEYQSSDNRAATLDKQFGSDSEFIKRVKETIPGLRAYLSIHSGAPSTHMTTAGSGGTPHLWGSLGMHHAGTVLDPYARMLVGVDPTLRTSGKGDAGFVDVPANPATVQEQIDAVVEWLKAFDEKMKQSPAEPGEENAK